MPINLLKAIVISTILTTATTLFEISSMGGMALAKVNLTPSGGTAGGLGLPPLGLGKGGSGGLERHTEAGTIDSGGGGKDRGGSINVGGGGGQTLNGVLIHGGSSGGKP
jgi:hypothetical protein